jgi:hypothetical protein
LDYPTIKGPDPAESPALAALLEQLKSRHPGTLGFLLYGSCLRGGDIFDGLLDLYLVCDNYRDALGNPAAALANALLPPNVYYAEQALSDRVLRCKYAVLSLADLRRCTGPTRFESYFWGRFAQPTAIVATADDSSDAALQACLVNAARTFMERTIPALPTAGAVTALWCEGLALSYATELRTERPGRSRELVDNDRAFYESSTRALADSLEFPLSVYHDGGALLYRAEPGSLRQRMARPAWLLRRFQGKLLSVARLVKGLFTFAGGLDYIAWKLERHSGQQVVIPDRVRRWPLVFMWGFFWRLYRRGVFK